MRFASALAQLRVLSNQAVQFTRRQWKTVSGSHDSPPKIPLSFELVERFDIASLTLSTCTKVVS